MIFIPPMTDPLGKYWEQPKTENIKLCDSHVHISQSDFEKLKNYSMSNPSGVYEGKMWKRFSNGSWVLCWYQQCVPPKEGFLDINVLPIKIIA